MNRVDQNLIFYSQSPIDSRSRLMGTAVPDDVPVVTLTLESAGPAPSQQAPAGAARTSAPALPSLNSSPFGASLDWRYRCYRVSTQPPGTTNFREHLYLFNILVALEWAPDEGYLEQLTWAFRRASDFLFDISDGWMAIGQVVIGGPELMRVANVQIMASNRLLPRSWVGGMHDPAKDLPIRLGRGLWNDRRRLTFAWEEPESYRTFVHEWAHYALTLTDAYTITRQVDQRNGNDLRLVRAENGRYTVVMPAISLKSESIMANIEGTSELGIIYQARPGADGDDQWAKIHTWFSQVPRERQVVSPGPRALPLPQLPVFQLLTAQPRWQASFPAWAPKQPHPIYAALGSDFAAERCWLYLLRGDTAPARVIAQGTLESHSASSGFALLGAAEDDRLICISDQRQPQPLVLHAQLSAGAAGELELTQINRLTATRLPTIEVVPQPATDNQRQAWIRVRVNGVGGAVQQVRVFPLDQSDDAQPPADLQRARDSPSGVWQSDPALVPTLDGHVLVRWDDQQIITTFSQGGGPSTHSPSPANPITAGSPDGSALLFFYQPPSSPATDQRAPAHADDYSAIKVITTLCYGSVVMLRPGQRACSPAFCIASNAALPAELMPTLVMYYDPPDDDRGAAERGLRICRLIGDTWTPLPTYLPADYPFAVAPLRGAAEGGSAGTLMGDGEIVWRVEYYMVCEHTPAP